MYLASASTALLRDVPPTGNSQDFGTGRCLAFRRSRPSKSSSLLAGQAGFRFVRGWRCRPRSLSYRCVMATQSSGS
jgi:hypothetical protein